MVAQGAIGASAITGSTLTVNGAYGSVAIPYPAGASAKDTAALVNAQTEKTGVSASARTEIGLSGLTAATSYTLKVASDNGVWVLRRPPLGHVLPTAHDMAREFKVLSGVAKVGYPAPSCVAFRKPALIFRAICINLQSDGVTDQM